MRKCVMSRILVYFYRFRFARWICLSLARRMEGGDYYSESIRDIQSLYYRVVVGAYSYGECMVPGSFPPDTLIGRYVSIASGVKVLRRNHPIERLSQHPFFYNCRLGFVSTDSVHADGLFVGHDSWIGANVIVLPRCKRIGIGAVVGAGSVVTCDVPDFAIVVGNPARVVRYRFSDDVRQAVLDSKWWELDVQELLGDLKLFSCALNDSVLSRIVALKKS